MFDPSNRETGRGLLLFALLMLGLGLWLGLLRQAWRDATLWLAIAICFGCYGLITLDTLPRQRVVLLILGLLAGAVAFAAALVIATG